MRVKTKSDEGTGFAEYLCTRRTHTHTIFYPNVAGCLILDSRERSIKWEHKWKRLMGRLLPNIVTHTAYAHRLFSILFIFFVFVARGTFLLFLDFRFQHTLSFPRIYTHTHTTFSPFFSVEIRA